MFVKQLDVSSLKAIHDLEPLDPPAVVLVQNAGQMADEYCETPDGFESTVATHVVSVHEPSTARKRSYDTY